MPAPRLRPAILTPDRRDEINQRLLAWFPAQEVGGALVDLSPWKRSGALVNSPTRAISTIGRVLDFNAGSAQHVEITPAQGDIPQYTWAFWLWTSSASSTGSIVQPLRQGADGVGFSYSHVAGPFQSAAYHRDGGGNYYSAQIPPADLVVSTWHFIAATWSGSNLAMFHNGVRKATTATAAGFYGPTDIFRFGGMNNFTGQMQNVRIWSRALSDGEIGRLYADRWAGLAKSIDFNFLGWQPAAAGTVYNDTISDAATVADALAAILTARATTSDAATTADSLANTRTALASMSDGATLADAIAGAVAIATTIADAATVGEAIAAILTARASTSDAATLAESLAAVLTISATTSDGVTVADALAAVLRAVAATSDPATLAEALATALSTSATVSDGATLADGVTFGSFIAETISDAATLADSLARALTLAGAVSDAATVADSVAAILAAVASVEDPAAMADALSTILGMNVSVQDAATLADLISALGSGTTIPSTRRVLRLPRRTGLVTLPRRSGLITLPRA